MAGARAIEPRGHASGYARDVDSESHRPRLTCRLEGQSRSGAELGRTTGSPSYAKVARGALMHGRARDPAWHNSNRRGIEPHRL